VIQCFLVYFDRYPHDAYLQNHSANKAVQFPIAAMWKETVKTKIVSH